MNRIIVAGSRDFNEYEFVARWLDYYLGFIDGEIEIVSGKCKGVDALGEQYANDNNYPVKPFTADWNKHGIAAGPIRNQQMADYATHLIAFPAKDSKGTKDMIKKATDKKLHVITVNIEP